MPDTTAEQHLTDAEALIRDTLQTITEITGMGAMLLPPDATAIIFGPDSTINFITPKAVDGKAELTPAWANIALVRALFSPNFSDILEALELRLQAQFDQICSGAH